MISAIRVPSLDASTVKATLIRLLVPAGHVVKAGECIAEIETEKTTFPVESPWAGRLEKILVTVGAEIPIGSPIATIQTDDTSAEPFIETNETNKAKIANEANALLPIRSLESSAADSKNAGSTSIRQTVAQQTVYTHLYGCTQPQNVLFNAGEFSSRTYPLTAAFRIPAPLTNTHSSKENKMGRVDAQDSTENESDSKNFLEKFVARSVPIKEVRPLIGSPLRTMQRMTYSARQIPSSSIALPIEIASLRERLQAHRAATRQLIQPTDAILWAAACTLKEYPEFNAFRSGEKLHIYEQINLGIVYDIKGELLVPSILNANTFSMSDFSKEIRILYKEVTARTIPIRKLGVATFVTSNLFGSGVTHAHPLVNAGNSAVLLIGAAFQQGLSDESGLRFVEHVHLILGFDHTFINGMKASAFLRSLKKRLDLLSFESHASESGVLTQ